MKHLVLDEGILVDQPVCHMLVQKGIFVEAGGEEAAQHGPRPRAWARPVRWPSGFNPCQVFSFAATISPAPIQITSREFQSLSGFLVRCNYYSEYSQLARYRVSIPVGFSSSLQHNTRRTDQTSVGLFQSLSGFLVRCNICTCWISS